MQGEQLGWADSLGPYFKDLEFLVEGFVIHPRGNGSLKELDAIVFAVIVSLPLNLNAQAATVIKALLSRTRGRGPW